MGRRAIRVVLLVGSLVSLSPATAGFEAGQRAWDAGRTDQALAEWRAGAAAGERQAMLALGRLYVQGLGVIQDYVEAHKWLNLAASRGEVEALQERDALAERMTPQQVATAQERAAAWRPDASEAAGARDAGPAPETVAAEDDAPSSAPSPSRAPAPTPPPPPQAIREAQALLAALGYEVGAADGKWGPRSGRAYRAFVRDVGLPAAETLTPNALVAMRRIAAWRGVTPSPAPPAPSPRDAGTVSVDVLHLAAKMGDDEAVSALLRAGSKVDGRDDRGWTALMHAASEGRSLVTERLLAARADPDTRAPDGATPLFLAVSRGHAGIVARLRNAGADPWLVGPDGRAPADVARAGGAPAVVAALRLPAHGETIRDCPDCPEMVVVREGSYMMGSPLSEPGRWEDEGPRHEVRIARPFAVGRYEVTFAEWDACRRAGRCSHSPADGGWGQGGRPAINVSWKDAKEHVGWLSEKTGKPYRLLSEAEWEYAARAKTDSAYYWGAEVGKGRANCGRCGEGWGVGKTTPAGGFPPNGFGLFDMSGNVWEWVEDCGHRDYTGAPSDGSAWLKSGDCRFRMLRGGSWDDAAARVRSAIRHWEATDARSDVIGFRVARTLD